MIIDELLINYYNNKGLSMISCSLIKLLIKTITIHLNSLIKVFVSHTEHVQHIPQLYLVTDIPFSSR